MSQKLIPKLRKIILQKLSILKSSIMSVIGLLFSTQLLLADDGCAGSCVAVNAAGSPSGVYTLCSGDQVYCENSIDGGGWQMVLSDILDAISLVNLVLSSEYNPSADLNNDGVVNILDVVVLVNIILYN